MVTPRRPRLLDLFCGGGGAGMGYHRAGFDVVGVDTNRLALRHYPFQAVRADALQVLAHWDLSAFDAIHASPPCQSHSTLAARWGHKDSTHYPDFLAATWYALDHIGLPYVVENVPGAPMPGALTLCGSEFGLSATDRDGARVTLKRHRRFVSNVLLMGAGGCHCAYARARLTTAGVYGQGGGKRRDGGSGRGNTGYTVVTRVAHELMGMDWGSRDTLAQAIPPAYTQHIGAQLLDHLNLERAG